MLNYTERTSVHCLGYPLTASQTNNSNLFPNFHGAAVYRISWAYSLQQIHDTADIHNESCIFLFSNFPMDCIFFLPCTFNHFLKTNCFKQSINKLNCYMVVLNFKIYTPKPKFQENKPPPQRKGEKKERKSL